jgi:hypothetical protein
MAQIKNLLQSGSTGPYHDVLDLLDNMKTQLVAEQTTQRAIYEDQMVDCTDEMTMRTGEMDEATDAETSSQAAFDACTESKGIYIAGQTQLQSALASKKAQ